MTTQSEQALENGLIQQLETLGFEKIQINDENELNSNLKRQLEKHNKTKLSKEEFNQILNRLNRGNLFEKAKILRDKIDYTTDDGNVGYIELIDQIHYCKNEYQVTNQVTMRGKYTNRYDVTLLVNGLPLVQIELKRRGLELKEAFNQTLRYARHSFAGGKGLFGYIQLFVITNGVNTKYYANNPNSKQDYKQTFFWSDKDNKKVTQLSEFAEEFLEKCQLSKLITKYVVLNDSMKMLMVLRPYQYYAVEAIVERVKNTIKHGYIWHTTGSGKTLTSFKAAQILTQSPHVHKVLFVVDRKDLDYQTIQEFNSFSEGSVDATNNTKKLVEQLKDDTRLIVTTLQKLNTAISKPRYVEQLPAAIQENRMILIFDECHRSQFGDTHQHIRKYFPKAQMFGFTGTPIFAENSSAVAHGKRTTKDLFDKCLSKYVITDAIRDGNVLKFAVEYIKTVRQKEGVTDIQVEAIDKSEVMEADERIDAVTDHIIANHNRKTHSREFTSILCVSSIPALIKYYGSFKKKKDSGDHQLRIATIFSYQTNEDDKDEAGFIEADLPDGKTGRTNVHSRENLDAFIVAYNDQYGTNFSTDSFYQYYKDIGKKVKTKQVDILLVVNMFLTGFDSKYLNTIYVDKNLKYHGLIQAFSRTNRILGTRKSQGNVVCYRNLKSATDKAIELFANKEAIEEVVLQPYEYYVDRFNAAVDKLKGIAPTIDDVSKLQSEEERAVFITEFRNLIRLKNILVCFTEFNFEDVKLDEQELADYQSKYLDLHQQTKADRQTEKVSILDDIDFELELIHRDDINVSYILQLLENIQDAQGKEQDKIKAQITKMLETEIQLRSKKELIERFIAEHLDANPDGVNLRDSFNNYWDEEKEKAISELAQSEGLKAEGLTRVIENHLFTEKMPLPSQVEKIMHARPNLKERTFVMDRIIEKIREFVGVYFDGVD